MESYLDPDMAYLLGLITIRGSLFEQSGDRRIIIEFPFKSLVVEGLAHPIHQQEQLQIAVSEIRDRLYELLEADISVDKARSSVQFKIRFLRNSIAWRNVTRLMRGERSYSSFEVPPSIFTSPDKTIQIEYLRGIADAGGFIRDSNRYLNGKRRVYIEVSNQNWALPIQICRLLQQHLEVPVQVIQWGHPNVRQPNKTSGSGWAKEHQLKVFAEVFRQVGFHVSYKQRLLEKFAEEDLESGSQPLLRCNPNPELRRIGRKPRHPGERSELLPKLLRRRHFDAYWQICLAMGCQQCTEPHPEQPVVDEPEE